jgi:hypothetical protein
VGAASIGGMEKTSSGGRDPEEMGAEGSEEMYVGARRHWHNARHTHDGQLRHRRACLAAGCHAQTWANGCVSWSRRGSGASSEPSSRLSCLSEAILVYWLAIC